MNPSSRWKKVKAALSPHGPAETAESAAEAEVPAVRTRPLPLIGYGPVVGMLGPVGTIDYGVAASIIAAGGTVLPIPLVADRRRLHALFQMCDGLALPGGQDVAPNQYGEEANPDCKVDAPDVPSDVTEIQLTQWAIADGMPVLAICRGIQVLNVACNGTLWQDLRQQEVTTRNHNVRDAKGDLAHDALLVPGSRLQRIVGVPSIRVNSFHHQAIKDVGDSLTVTARSEDGVVEAVEVRGHPFGVGVQFHPESLSREHQWAHDLFDNLVIEAGRYADAERPEREFPPAQRQMWRRARPELPAPAEPATL